jgi:hypothetical protein
MLTIKKSVGNVVASDTQETVALLDRSVAQQSRMCASVIEASHDSDLPMSATQPMLEALTDGLADLISGRAKLGKAVRALAALQANSTLRETSFGCPNGPYLRATPETAKTVEVD